MRLMDYLGKIIPKGHRGALSSPFRKKGRPRTARKAGRKRSFLISGGEVDTERMSRILDEFRGGKPGRFTLEFPPEGERITSVNPLLMVMLRGLSLSAA